MDRSFLSDKELIKTSRAFVCIRTATYEDKQEAEFLKWAFLGRSGGELRNFGYCILSPNGKTQLRRSVRGPNFAYANSYAMVADLRVIAKQYLGKKTVKESSQTVPQMKSVRLGINVASCDGLPSVIVIGKNQTEVDQLNKKLSSIIWDEELAGKFIYASTTNPDDLGIVYGTKTKNGILVVKPDPYGLKGQVIKVINRDVSEKDLKDALSQAANAFMRNSKIHGQHVRNGRQSGKIWKTEVPVPNRRTGKSKGKGAGYPQSSSVGRRTKWTFGGGGKDLTKWKGQPIRSVIGVFGQPDPSQAKPFGDGGGAWTYNNLNITDAQGNPHKSVTFFIQNGAVVDVKLQTLPPR